MNKVKIINKKGQVILEKEFTNIIEANKYFIELKVHDNENEIINNLLEYGSSSFDYITAYLFLNDFIYPIDIRHCLNNIK